jgi:hypothetical protein
MITGSVMSQGRRSGDVGESLFLQASSPREAQTLDAAVAGLASLRVIRASQGGAIDFAARPFNNRKPTTRDGIGLNSGALLVREWRGKLERGDGAR